MTCAKRLNSLEKQCPMRAVDHDWSGGSMDLKKVTAFCVVDSWEFLDVISGRHWSRW